MVAEQVRNRIGTTALPAVLRRFVPVLASGKGCEHQGAPQRAGEVRLNPRRRELLGFDKPLELFQVRVPRGRNLQVRPLLLYLRP